ncbi:MAG: transporter associated domain-containing protein [Pseudomonadota bacterium]
MSDENPPPSISWIDRIGQFLQGEPKDREELVDELRAAEQRGLIKPDALSMLEGVMQVSEMQVRDIMIPRTNMVIVERDASFQEILPIVVESQHSRFPVIGDTKDDVVGILLAKDLLAYVSHLQSDTSTKFSMRNIVRPAVIIPESKRLDVLLKDFRSSRNHIAIVVDEYGGVSGLVTIEDVLEQIVGDIEDEYDIDEEEDNIKVIGDNEYTIKALTTIDDFNEYFNQAFCDSEFDTIAGLVLQAFGHMPSQGEVIAIENFNFEVLHADGRRINLLRATLQEDNQRDENVA